MASTKTKTTVTAGLAVLALGVAFAIWRIHHPPVNDAVFRMDYIGLQRAPDNVLILRPTHFAGSLRRGDVTYASTFQAGKPVQRMMGYKVLFAQLIAAAYECAPGRVILPPDAPKGEYDFLVTLSDKPDEHLRAAIQKKLGWVAGWEPHETEVLLLKVKTPDAPALHLSTNGQKTSLFLQNGQLQATHLRLAYLSGLLENALKYPVLDRTGQTNFYDFSLEWEPNQFPDSPDLASANKILGQIGIELQPDKSSMPMLVVKKAN